MKQYAQYKRFTRSRAGSAMYFIFLFLLGAFSILPMLYTVFTAFKPLDELLVFPPRFFVSRPTWDNFAALPGLLGNMRVPLSRYVFNSVFVTVVSTVVHILVASMAAFTLSKSKMRGMTAVFLIIQFSLLYNTYNTTSMAVPQYLIFTQLRIIDTLWVYILPALQSSMGVFLIKQYIDGSVPDTLLEAAKIDGASVFTTYSRIVMPLIKPAWMTLTLFSFQSMWSNIPQGTVFSEHIKTLPYVMSAVSVVTGGMARSGSAMATSVILMIPPIVVYFITQSNVMETMSSAGIKD